MDSYIKDAGNAGALRIFTGALRIFNLDTLTFHPLVLQENATCI